MAKINIYLRTALIGVFVFAGAGVFADDYVLGWGPEVGAAMPVLQAADQDGTPRDLTSLAGKQGLLLFVNRSADW
jgi:hypothetical protein